MAARIMGLHHITAIAGDALRNYDFYTYTMGLRFIKKTVNFDDPGTYHLYFGDKHGNAGTILTFFPWGPGIPRGRRGTGMTTEIGYSVPPGSLGFWTERFENHQVIHNKPQEKFGEKYMTFLDPDGLKLELIEPHNTDSRIPWDSGGVRAESAVRGFHNITLTLRDHGATAEILTDIFGYSLLGQEEGRYRYATDAVPEAAIVDLVEVPLEKRGHVANGTVHHVAFRVKDDLVLMDYRKKVEGHGLEITPMIDRNYFHSLYFREPGGVLFEIATENPGFTVDEPLNELGKSLKLPLQYESRRAEIESGLPAIN